MIKKRFLSRQARIKHMLSITISSKQTRQHIDHAAGPIEFGRGPQRDAVARVVIADDLRVSRDHLSIEELPKGLIKVENLSQQKSLRLNNNARVPPGEVSEVMLPAQLTIGETHIEICLPDLEATAPGSFQTVSAPVRGQTLQTQANQSLLELATGGLPAPETLAHWFETVIAVQRAAAGSAGRPVRRSRLGPGGTSRAVPESAAGAVRSGAGLGAEVEKQKSPRVDSTRGL
jgi:adenylate cyclase